MSDGMDFWRWREANPNGTHCEAYQAGYEAAREWLPIETAPKDGTDVLLSSIGQTFLGHPMPDRVTIGHWTTDEECREQIGDCGGECRCPEYRYDDPSWLSWDGGFTKENPATHWQPLPTPPATGGEG